ncbi:hypothetical protein V6N12_048975 [Hibiscus sabdariffa]|uniref:Uncharacterized protein n=1 Tax=Hibiscus sabdariffa TaxID=183260 RepID=A0ABR2EJ70_9ROSI
MLRAGDACISGMTDSVPTEDNYSSTGKTTPSSTKGDWTSTGTVASVPILITGIEEEDCDLELHCVF